MEKIILASGSPARRKILEDLGLKFDVVASDFDERFIDSGIMMPELIHQDVVRNRLKALKL